MLPAYSLAAPALGWLLLLLGRGGFGEAGWYLALKGVEVGGSVVEGVHPAGGAGMSPRPAVRTL
ncbi:MAG TPA: hypothetical protein PKD73_18135, partial [Burkholderiaceae bacterium]|nr:hypothetical protein [Burkholderiaceae bacterium]